MVVAYHISLIAGSHCWKHIEMWPFWIDKASQSGSIESLNNHRAVIWTTRVRIIIKKGD